MCGIDFDVFCYTSVDNWVVFWIMSSGFVTESMFSNLATLLMLCNAVQHSLGWIGVLAVSSL